MPSPKSTREVFAGSSLAERVEISEIRPSSTMSSGFAISSAGVNRRLAVNAVFMGQKWEGKSTRSRIRRFQTNYV